VNNLDLKLRIVAPDMFGWCGRDFHPTREMIGETVTVLAMNRYNVEDGMPDDLGDLQLFHCLRAPGSQGPSLVDVFDFEVELVSAEPVQ
jgi:hypothetical protein